MEEKQIQQNVDCFQDIRSIIEDIRVNFLFMTKEVLMKTNRFINKQIIDSIKNYFFENQIGTLLKPKMEKDSLKKVKSEIEDNIKCDPENKYQEEIPKYMIFMNAYIEQIEKYSLHEDYQNLLYDIILSENQSKGFSDDWMTQMRKKITAVLLLGHFNTPNRQNLKNIFDLWANAYPTQQLNKVKKNFKNSKQSQSIQADQNNVEQSLSSDSDGNESEEDEEEVIIEINKNNLKKLSKQKQTVIQNSKPRKQSLIKQKESIITVQQINELKQNDSQINIESIYIPCQPKRQRLSKQQKDKKDSILKTPISQADENNKQKQELEVLKPRSDVIILVKKRGRKSKKTQQIQNSNDNDETSFSPFVQGVETCIAETQFIIDHEEEEDEEVDDEETNPQNYNRHISIIPNRSKRNTKSIQKKSSSKIISKSTKISQKIPKQKQRKQKQQSQSVFDQLNQLNQTNEEKTTSLCFYKDKAASLFEKDQNLNFTQQCAQSYQSSPDKKKNINNSQNILEDQSIYLSQYNYKIISSSFNNNPINQNQSQYYFNYPEQSQATTIQSFNNNNNSNNNNNANTSNFYSQQQTLQQDLTQQQYQSQQQIILNNNNNQNYDQSTQTNQLLYNKIPTPSYQYNNYQPSISNNLYSNINTECEQQASAFQSFIPNNNHYKQNYSIPQQQQQFYHNEILSKEDSNEIYKIQHYSPLHYSEQETIQHKHHDNFNQDLCDYLNFDHDNLNPNFGFSLYDIASNDNQENIFKFHHEIDFSQELQIELKKNNSLQQLQHQHNQQQLQEDGQLNLVGKDTNNNQMSLETNPKNNKNIGESEFRVEFNHQRKDINKGDYRWKSICQRLEDKTEITLTQEKQSEDREDDVSSIKSNIDELYKDNISLDDYEDELLTQSF